MIKCCDLRADDSIRKSAIAKGDSRIIGVLSREIVAAEAWYHRSCYRDYTRQRKRAAQAQVPRARKVMITKITMVTLSHEGMRNFSISFGLTY